MELQNLISTAEGAHVYSSARTRSESRLLLSTNEAVEKRHASNGGATEAKWFEPEVGSLRATLLNLEFEL